MFLYHHPFFSALHPLLPGWTNVPLITYILTILHHMFISKLPMGGVLPAFLYLGLFGLTWGGGGRGV
jgi:hypothetical protein